MNDTTQISRPNLLLIGAQKSGTTSLATALAAHRQIYLPSVKELHFFSNRDWAENVDAYYDKFKGRSGFHYRMDATPGYMWTRTKYGQHLGDGSPMKHDIPAAIRKTLGPDTRIIAIMRHPVRRAVSAFFHHFRMGRLGTNTRIRDIGHRQGIVDLGFYSEHLAAYRLLFPADVIKTYFFEDYVKNMEQIHRELFLWLDLDPVETSKGSVKTNPGMKLEYSNGCISLKNGLEQIKQLAEDPHYSKMKIIPPPIVEQADLDFLNDIYDNELKMMAQDYEITRRIWPRRLTIDTYNEHPGTSKNQ